MTEKRKYDAEIYSCRVENMRPYKGDRVRRMNNRKAKLTGKV